MSFICWLYGRGGLKLTLFYRPLSAFTLAGVAEEGLREGVGVAHTKTCYQTRVLKGQIYVVKFTILSFLYTKSVSEHWKLNVSWHMFPKL